MEKLELQQDKERAAKQFQNQKLMLQMMKDMFQPSTQQQQTPGTTLAKLPFASTLSSGIPSITTTDIHQRSEADELVASMNRTKLNTDDSEKKRKFDDRMNMDHGNEHPKLPLPPGSQQ